MAGHDAAQLPGHSGYKAESSASDTRLSPSSEPGPVQRRNSPGDSVKKGGSARRKGKLKSGGGFLLRNPFSGNLRSAARGSVRELFQTSKKASRKPKTPQSPRSNDSRSLQPTNRSGGRPSHNEASPSSRSEASGQGFGSSRGSAEPMTQELSRSSEENTGDADSTEIVQMALDLGESRRIASRRHVSRATPPRLGPQPDGTSGSNLRRHLQQPRKFSLNGSPKIQQGPSPRSLSSARLDSPLLAAGFESAYDGHYRYQFSPSTLARAAKARDHLELMAQYRRLLDVLPPLKAGLGSQAAMTPPGSPAGSRPVRFNHGDNLPLGRQYNPLQYIRNRKVRARERKVIDAEKQGFGDVEFVKTWVDRVIERATSFATDPDDEGDSIMPKYPDAEEVDAQQLSPDAHARAATRPRRPRVDWFVEPCEIMADAYWLEQDNHKELVEDRHWRKIFPPATTNPSRPVSRGTAAIDPDAIPPFSMQDDGALDSQIPALSEVETGLSHNSAKDRAKQRLHNIKALPHRHHGQTMHADFMWPKKDSASDVSGSETDRRGRLKMTEEQMLATVTEDARRASGHVSDARSDAEPGRHFHFHSRKESLADTSDSDRKPTAETLIPASPLRHSAPGSQSLDVLDGSRKDLSGKDHPLPTAPELRPPRESMEAPSSEGRSGSPHRNPISKIKQIIRDKGSSKPGGEQEDVRREPALELSWPEKPDPLEDHLATGAEQVVPAEPVRTHRRNGSAPMRLDEAAGLRGIFKAGGPRLDTVLRGGVSRLGDMFWRREGVSGLLPYAETTDESDRDESDNEKAAGGSGSCTNLSSRRPSGCREEGQQQQQHTKQFLDTMPQFHNVYGRQSPQSGTVRRNQLDARSASTSALLENRRLALGVSDASDSESRGVADSVGDASKRRNPITDDDVPPPREEDDMASFRSRHWSIAADKGSPATDSTRLTRREIARMRALLLSTGVKAMEISRRALEAQRPFCPDDGLLHTPTPTPSGAAANLNWADVARLCPDDTAQPRGRSRQDIQVACYELYTFAGRSLGAAIQNAGRRWQASADEFTYRTSPQLQNRIGDVRSRVADDLSEQSQRVGDLADETNRDLALGQPLRVKAVVDTIGKMLRQRRRRLRWVRRALWLTVEWLLVGFMWYVWAVVMVLRVFLGIGKGVVRSARWLLWL